jgi:hypothetical protein
VTLFDAAERDRHEQVAVRVIASERPYVEIEPRPQIEGIQLHRRVGGGIAGEDGLYRPRTVQGLEERHHSRKNPSAGTDAVPPGSDEPLRLLEQLRNVAFDVVVQVEDGQDLTGDLRIGLAGQRHPMAGGRDTEQCLDGGGEGGGTDARRVHQCPVDVPEDDPFDRRHGAGP